MDIIRKCIIDQVMSEPFYLKPVPKPYTEASFDKNKYYLFYDGHWLFGRVSYNIFTNHFDMHAVWATPYSQIDDSVERSGHDIYEIPLPKLE